MSSGYKSHRKQQCNILVRNSVFHDLPKWRRRNYRMLESRSRCTNFISTDTTWPWFWPNCDRSILENGVYIATRYAALTLNAPIATKVVCFSRLLKYLRSLYDKQCGPRSDCSYRNSLFWVHAICFYTLFVSNVRQLFAADDFSRRHFQMHFFLGALRVS